MKHLAKFDFATIIDDAADELYQTDSMRQIFDEIYTAWGNAQAAYETGSDSKNGEELV